jgi:hypothetical protein
MHRRIACILCYSMLVIVPVAGCSGIPQRKAARQLFYVDWQERGSARVLGQQFRELTEILPPKLVDDAEQLAENWNALAIGDIDEPPCDGMRAAYQALGDWLRHRSDAAFADPSIPLENKSDWTYVQAAATRWQHNDECNQFRLSSTVLHKELYAGASSKCVGECGENY